MQEIQETRLQSLDCENAPWSREWQPAPVFLPGKSHGRRRLAGYSPGGCKESNTLSTCSTWLINNVSVLGVQQSDSVIHIHVSIPFQVLFLFRLLENIEESYLCYTPCWLSVLNIAVCIHQSREKAMAPYSSTVAHKIPWMEEPGRLQSMGSLRVGHD